MKIFVAGATGVLGRPSVKALAEGGHDVLGVARTPEKAALLDGLGATPVTVDLFDAEQVRDAVFGCEALINLATRWMPKRWRSSGEWKENDRLRRDASQNLAAGARDAGIKLYIQESVTFFYRDGGEEWLSEEAPVDASWISIESMLAGERVAGDWASDTGGRAVILRFGTLYGPDASSTIETGKQARLRTLSVPAGGKHYISSIHAEDAAAAVLASLDLKAGVYNVVDDEPMKFHDYAYMIARTVGADMRDSAPPGMPGFLYKLSFGGMASYLLRSQRVSNAKLKEASDWAPKYVNATAGWQQVVGSADWPHYMGELEKDSHTG